MLIRRWWLAAMILHAACCAGAKAQCEEWIPSGDGASGLILVNDLAAVDHDGEGPADPVLYATGFQIERPTSPIVAWRGRFWDTTSLPGGSLFSLDHPAAGGLTAGQLLIVSTGFWAWNGFELRTIGSTSPADYSAQSVTFVTTWDPDGPGPVNAWIIVAGEFTRFSGTTALNIVAWNGEAWIPLGTGLSNRIVRAVSFDPDGHGPTLPLLVAADTMGQVRAWDGSGWRPLGSPLGSISGLVAHDADGPGGVPPRLYASTTGIDAPAWLGWWDGLAWVESEPGFPGSGSRISNLVSLDLDGGGPSSITLVALGAFLPLAADQSRYTVALLTPGGWTRSYGSPDSPAMPSSYAPIYSAVAIDPDGNDGPRSIELIVGGGSTRVGGINGVDYPGLGAWNAPRWRTLGDEIVNDTFGGQWFQASIFALIRHDPDGPGPEQPAIYAAGNFRSAGGVLCDRLARWDGQRFVGLGTPQNNALPISELKSIDPDGPGGEPPMLIGITHRLSPSTQALHWTGSAWLPIQNDLSQVLNDVELYDADGDGPAAPLMVGVSAANRNLLRYVGGQWENAYDLGSTGYRLLAARHGLSQSRLYILTNAWSSNWPFRWLSGTVGSSSLLSFNYSNDPPQRLVWDRDGLGPLAPDLVIGAYRINNTRRMAAMFVDENWIQLGTNAVETYCTGLVQFDPDGDGPIAPSLFFGESFNFSNQSSVIQRLRDQEWAHLHSPPIQNPSVGLYSLVFRPAVRAFLTVDPDEDGPLPPELWVGGAFTHVAGQPSKNFARMRYTVNPPAFVQFPADAAGCIGSPLSIPTRVQGASQIEWHLKDPAAPGGWRTLTDGPLLLGGIDVGTIEGTGADTLRVLATRDMGALEVRCRLINACHTFTSHEVRLSFCVADFNCTGGTPDDADVDAFFVAWNNGDSTADINASGGTPDDADVDAFFTRWNAGC